jgi:hypothetical protein
MRKTNKTIITCLFALMVLIVASCAVSAGLIPLPISGRVEGETATVEGLSISVTNLRTSETILTKSNYAGEWLIDWDTDRVSSGDQFRVQVDICADISSQCVSTSTYTGQPEIFTIINVEGLAPSCPSCPTCGGGGGSGGVIYKATQELCDKDFPCKEPVCAICPSEPVCPEPSDPVSHPQCNTCCDEPPECIQEECPDCTDEPNLALLIQAIILWIGIMGGGIKIYKNYKGGVNTLHRHRGILGYHDWNINHRNPAYRHIAYEDDTTKSKSQFTADLTKINEEGGLV